MNTICVTNKNTGRSYQAVGPIYETDFVWCGTAEDAELGECFVKLIRYGAYTADRQKLAQEWAQREATTMEKAAKCTDRVPKLYDHWNNRNDKTYVMVMQKMPGYSLREWMKRHPIRKLDEQTVFVRSLIIRQLAQILHDIHFRIPGISHRDLKPENVMIRLDDRHRWQVSLIDFGTAGLPFSVGVGTTGYQAPEQKSLQGTLPGSGASKDVYALGIIWYELLTGKSAADIDIEFLSSLDEPEWEFRPSMPQAVLDTATGRNHQQLFEKMTAFNPAKRPALDQVVRNIPQRRNYR